MKRNYSISLYSVFFSITYIVVSAILSYADPPFEVPPEGGLVQCQEELNMCVGDLNSCTTDLSNTETELTQAQDELASCEAELYKRVFITNQRFDANLGGVTGANAECNAAAAAAGLSGTFKAWISDSASSPSSSFSRSTQPYALLDETNTRIADNWTDLTTCDEGPSNDECLDNMINVDENGDVVVPVNDFSGGLVWTNTTQAGMPFDTDDIFTCGNFGLGPLAGAALAGRFTSVDDKWTVDVTINCGLLARLYCFEQ